MDLLQTLLYAVIITLIYGFYHISLALPVEQRRMRTLEQGKDK